MRHSPYILLLIPIFLLFGCGSPKATNEKSERESILQWRKQRIARLTRNDSWLSLAGLFWLEPGENRFGFSPKDDIRFPDSTRTDHLGRFILENGRVRVVLETRLPVTIDGARLKTSSLRSDADGRPTHMEFGRYLWYVIKRGERFGIRLKDRQNAAIRNFKGLDYFPVSSRWKVEARFIPYDPPRKVAVPTVLGTKALATSPGELEFTLSGKRFRLQTLARSPKDTLSIIFGDATNGNETYGAGRFLEVPPVDAQGKTVIDFNKAYNPPCAFTPYATCPLPPAMNILPVAVKAGEKMYRGASHH